MEEKNMILGTIIGLLICLLAYLLWRKINISPIEKQIKILDKIAEKSINTAHGFVFSLMSFDHNFNIIASDQHDTDAVYKVNNRKLNQINLSINEISDSLMSNVPLIRRLDSVEISEQNILQIFSKLEEISYERKKCLTIMLSAFSLSYIHNKHCNDRLLKLSKSFYKEFAKFHKDLNKVDRLIFKLKDLRLSLR